MAEQRDTEVLAEAGAILQRLADRGLAEELAGDRDAGSLAAAWRGAAEALRHAAAGDPEVEE